MTITHCAVCGAPTSLTGSCPSHPVSMTPTPDADADREAVACAMQILDESGEFLADHRPPRPRLRPPDGGAVRTFTGTRLVVITDRDHPMCGAIGAVGRRRMCDNGAWVTMTEDPPPEVRCFPLDDSRGRHVLLYPGQCRAFLGVPTPTDTPSEKT